MSPTSSSRQNQGILATNRNHTESQSQKSENYKDCLTRSTISQHHRNVLHGSSDTPTTSHQSWPTFAWAQGTWPWYQHFEEF